MALGKHHEEIIHRRAENNARVIFEDQRPQGNYYRSASTKADLTIEQKIRIGVRVTLMKWESGGEPLPAVDKSRPTFAETFGIPLSETLHWSEDRIMALIKGCPEAAALLIMDYRDGIVDALQKKTALKQAQTG